ncbi:MAG: NAD-dependent epimerase, partial [Pseudomonadota bacterium]
RAVVSAYTQNKPGIYNVAPDQWMAYQDVLRACGCASLPVPSIPPAVPSVISRLLRWRAFPRYLVNYLKYPVLIDGGHFERTFGFQHERSLDDVLSYYRQRKNTPV